MTSNPIVTLFYRRLLELDPTQDARLQLEEALRLLVQATTASAAYLELFGDNHEPLFSSTVGLDADGLQPIRAAISHGLIAHAISAGRPLDMAATARELPSELAKEGVAICCAPITRETPVGIVYLQRPDRSFTASELHHIKLYAERVVPVCATLLPPITLEEQIAAHKRVIIRQELKRNGWNVTTTARSLGVGRAALYRALRRK